MTAHFWLWQTGLEIATETVANATNIFSLATKNSGLVTTLVTSHADFLRGSKRVPAPRTSAEPKDKFLSNFSQISAGYHMQIVGDPVGAVEFQVLTSQTHTYKLRRVWYVTKDVCSGQESRR